MSLWTGDILSHALDVFGDWMFMWCLRAVRRLLSCGHEYGNGLAKRQIDPFCGPESKAGHLNFLTMCDR